MEMLTPRIIVYQNVGAATTTMVDVTLLPTTVGPKQLESSLEQRTLPPLHKRRYPQPQHGHNENNGFTTENSSPLLCVYTITRDLVLKYRGGWEATLIEDPHPIITRECLSIGINEALYHHTTTETHNNPNKQHSHTQTGRSTNVYTLLTLQQSQSKVLVRSTNILLQLDQTTNDSEDDIQ